MPHSEIFKSELRAAGDFAGVFEYDGETGYFYLYKEDGSPNQKILGAIHVLSGSCDFGEGEIAIQWANGGNWVGLLIRSRLWAAFDCRDGTKYGGNYQAGQKPAISDQIVEMFTQGSRRNSI